MGCGMGQATVLKSEPKGFPPQCPGQDSRILFSLFERQCFIWGGLTEELFKEPVTHLQSVSGLFHAPNVLVSNCHTEVFCINGSSVIWANCLITGVRIC